MRDKVYQITINEAHYKRVKNRLDMCVTAHNDYAESKNINHWDDPIAKSLADDLFICHRSLEQFLDELFKNGKEI